MKTTITIALIAGIALLGLAGCSVPEECCCCYFVDEWQNAECTTFSSDELGATPQRPCGEVDAYPEPAGYEAFICGYDADTMSVASQYQSAADACVEELEGS